MKNKLVASLVLGTLVLVGGGCLGKKAAPSPAPPVMPSGGAATETMDDGTATDADSVLNADLPAANVDAAVDDIVKSLDAEAASDDEAADAGDLDSMMSDTKDLEGIGL